MKVVGLDVSLSRTACVALPAAWSCAWGESEVKIVEGGPVPHGLGFRQERIRRISAEVVDWVRIVGAEAIFIEEHAFGFGAGVASGKPFERAELVGVIKDRIYWGLAIIVVPIVASSARKLLFGTIPRKGLPRGGTKKVIAVKAYAAGAPHAWKEDEIDAFIIANAGRSSLGLPALSVGDT